MNPPSLPPLRQADYEALSDFRHQLRKFERFSENAAQAEGITPLQYVTLLHIKGMRERTWASIGELAERLQAHSHGVVALVSRCELAGLVERRQNADDRRLVEVHLLEKGEAVLARLAALHREELKMLGGVIHRSIQPY